MKLIEKHVTFDENADGLFIKNTHEIPDWFLTQCRQEKADSLHTPAGDFHKVASVPEGVWDDWIAQGIDVWNLTAKEVIKLLNQQQVDAFITTNKRI